MTSTLGADEVMLRWIFFASVLHWEREISFNKAYGNVDGLGRTADASV